MLEMVDEMMDWRRCGTDGWLAGGGFELSIAFWIVIIISMVDNRAS